MDAANARHAGGVVAVVDWEKKGFENLIELPFAAGLLQLGGSFYVAAYDSIIELSNCLDVRSSQEVPYANNLHGIASSEGDAILMASSGNDCVIKYCPKSNHSEVLWSAYESGINTTSSGIKRSLDDHKSYSDLYFPLPMHTTHVNSVIEFEGGTYATLFQQGDIIRIDGESSYETVATDLTTPHSLRFNSNGEFVICEARYGRVRELNSNFESQRTFDIDSTWLQSVVPFSGGYLASDANGARLVELDSSGEVAGQFSYPSEWKVFDAIPL